MSKTKQFIWATFFPLLTGTLIYLFFRSETLVIFDWLQSIHLKEFIIDLKQSSFIKSLYPNTFTKYSLPDGLWIFSFVSGTLLIWDNKLSMQNIFWILSIPFFGIITEIGQFSGIIKGTFDIYDFICYLTGALIPIIIFTKLLTLKTKKI